MTSSPSRRPSKQEEPVFCRRCNGCHTPPRCTKKAAYHKALARARAKVFSQMDDITNFFDTGEPALVKEVSDSLIAFLNQKYGKKMPPAFSHEELEVLHETLKGVSWLPDRGLRHYHTAFKKLEAYCEPSRVDGST